jgi:hypothetical protein
MFPVRLLPDAVKLTPVDAVPYAPLRGLDSVRAVSAGLVAANRVFAPPAVVVPDFVPEEKVKSLDVSALTLRVLLAVGFAAMSAVMNM